MRGVFVKYSFWYYTSMKQTEKMKIALVTGEAGLPAPVTCMSIYTKLISTVYGTN